MSTPMPEGVAEIIDHLDDPEYVRQLQELELAAFDQANEEMRAAGVPEEEIRKFWVEMVAFGDEPDLVDD